MVSPKCSIFIFLSPIFLFSPECSTPFWALKCIELHSPLALHNVIRRRVDDPAASRHEPARLEHGLGIRLVPRCPQTLRSWPAMRVTKSSRRPDTSGRRMTKAALAHRSRFSRCHVRRTLDMISANSQRPRRPKAQVA